MCLLGGLALGITAPEGQPAVLDHLERQGIEVNYEIREFAERLAAVQKDSETSDERKAVYRIAGATPYGVAGAGIGALVGVLLAPRRKSRQI